jgi:lipid-binding SYLF domain-containing protein
MMPILLMPSPAVAADAEDIDRDANATLTLLYQTTPAALRLPSLAKAILIFPSIVKAGFIGGAQYGNGGAWQGWQDDGLLQHDGRVLWAAGRRAIVQLAMLLMSDSAVAYLDKRHGWAWSSLPRAWAGRSRPPRPKTTSMGSPSGRRA